MGIHHLSVEAHQAANTAPLHGEQSKVGIGIREAAQEVAGGDEVGARLESFA